MIKSQFMYVVGVLIMYTAMEIDKILNNIIFSFTILITALITLIIGYFTTTKQEASNVRHR